MRNPMRTQAASKYFHSCFEFPKLSQVFLYLIRVTTIGSWDNLFGCRFFIVVQN